MEPIYLFLDEAHNIFPEWISLDVMLQYMAENSLGHVFIVDSSGVLKGMVSEASILTRLKDNPIGMKVSQVMRDQVYCTKPETTLVEVTIMMADRQIRRVPVTIKDKLIGIVTATDILHHVLAHSDKLESIPDDMIVEDVMREKIEEIMSRPISICPHRDLGEAIEKIVDNDISGLPVVTQENRLLGIVSRIDMITKPFRARGAAFLAGKMGV
ncbi:MAG: CBS domain-containing protein [Candidatus Hadarchaeaceae archaeon]